jgi:hypothetical protein
MEELLKFYLELMKMDRSEWDARFPTDPLAYGLEHALQEILKLRTELEQSRRPLPGSIQWNHFTKEPGGG